LHDRGPPAILGGMSHRQSISSIFQVSPKLTAVGAGATYQACGFFLDFFATQCDANCELRRAAKIIAAILAHPTAARRLDACRSDGAFLSVSAHLSRDRSGPRIEPQARQSNTAASVRGRCCAGGPAYAWVGSSGRGCYAPDGKGVANPYYLWSWHKTGLCPSLTPRSADDNFFVFSPTSKCVRPMRVTAHTEAD